MMIRKLEPISLKDIIIDSLKYSASDLKMLIVLGFVLLLADTAENLTYNGLFGDEIKLVFLVLLLLWQFLKQDMCLAKIILETVQGSR